MPDWYPVIRVARMFGRPPMEVETWPDHWINYALMADAAEEGARADRIRQARNMWSTD
jgi:hypothetical protein